MVTGAGTESDDATAAEPPPIPNKVYGVAVFSYPRIIDKVPIDHLPLPKYSPFYVDDHSNLALPSPQNHHRSRMEKKRNSRLKKTMDSTNLGASIIRCDNSIRLVAD